MASGVYVRTIPSLKKGKTWDELYGEEKTKKIKQSLSTSKKDVPSKRKGLTYTQIFGKEKSEKMREKSSVSHTGKIRTIGSRKKQSNTMKRQYNELERTSVFSIPEIHKKAEEKRYSRFLKGEISYEHNETWNENISKGLNNCDYNWGEHGIKACSLNGAKGNSKSERVLHEMVKTIIPNVKLNYHIKSDKTFLRPDIVSTEYKLVIEYDGSYFHNNYLADNQRDNRLINLGYKIIHYRDYLPTKSELREDIKKILTSDSKVIYKQLNCDVTLNLIKNKIYSEEKIKW